MRQRRKFSGEFKRVAVGLISRPGANLSQIIQSLEIGVNLLWRWRWEFESDTKKPASGSRSN